MYNYNYTILTVCVCLHKTQIFSLCERCIKMDFTSRLPFGALHNVSDEYVRGVGGCVVRFTFSLRCRLSFLSIASCIHQLFIAHLNIRIRKNVLINHSKPTFFFARLSCLQCINIYSLHINSISFFIFIIFFLRICLNGNQINSKKSTSISIAKMT